jgi:RNA polymerase sigma factor for flagellar operon FliA
MPEWAGSDVTDELARERLILEHIPLLKHIVGRMSFDVPGGLDRDDLYGFGMLGLIQAADAWDVSRGLKFSTFAYPRIRGAILDELRRTDFLPRGRRERVREVEGVVQRLEQEQGEPPTPEEIAAALGLTLDELDEVFVSAASAAQTSLDEGPAEALAAMLGDPRSEDPVGSAEWQELKSLLAGVIGGLPEQEQTVITLYYAEDLLLKEISDVLGVTESRVSQIHSRALYRMNRVFTSLTGSSERS